MTHIPQGMIDHAANDLRRSRSRIEASEAQPEDDAVKQGGYRYYGDRSVAGRLRQARLNAGFSSATAAARSFDWSPSTYRAHEGAVRALSADDLERYSRAFSCPPEWIENGEDCFGLPTIGDHREVARRIRTHDRQAAACRLKTARINAGYISALAACRSYGWKISTYAGHEKGVSAFDPNAAKKYGDAFDVDARWLLAGDR